MDDFINKLLQSSCSVILADVPFGKKNNIKPEKNAAVKSCDVIRSGDEISAMSRY